MGKNNIRARLEKIGRNAVAPVMVSSMYPDTWTMVKNDVIEEKAWTDLVGRVSVAGWRESLEEEPRWIKIIYRLFLSVLFVACTFYIIKGAIRWTSNAYVDEITDFASEQPLPFSNVTVCAQVYFNESFIRENLTIPNSTWRGVRALGISQDEFYHQLTLFLTPVARPRAIDHRLLTYFSKVVRANPQTEDYSSFALDAWVRCESMLRRCWFEGRELDCCERAVASIDEDGICFQLMLNMNSDNAYPVDGTFHQRTPGPNGGLIVEASLETRDFPWLDSDAQNGYRVLIGPSAFTTVSSVMVAPHGAETFVKVTPEKYVLSTNCAPRNRLTLPFDGFMFYDPDGYVCAAHQGLVAAEKYDSCHLPGFLYRPNKTIVCPPEVIYAGSELLVESDLKASILSIMPDSPGMQDGWIDRLVTEMETFLRTLMSKRAFCPKHCQYWSYSSTASFSYLEDDNSEPDGRMYSKIRIYYATLGYRQHHEVKEFSSYLAFCKFGQLIAVYLGMSIGSFVHLFYYVPRYLFYWNRRRLAHRHKVT